MQDEEERADEKAHQDLRLRVLFAGVQPHHVADLLETLDGKKAESDAGMPLFAEELSDEEMESYKPFSAEEVDETIALLRRFGVAVETQDMHSIQKSR